MSHRGVTGLPALHHAGSRVREQFGHTCLASLAPVQSSFFFHQDHG